MEQHLFTIHESMDTLDLEDTVRRQRVGDWVNHVTEILGGLINVPASDIARPWELYINNIDNHMGFRL